MMVSPKGFADRVSAGHILVYPLVEWAKDLHVSSLLHCVAIAGLKLQLYLFNAIEIFIGILPM